MPDRRVSAHACAGTLRVANWSVLPPQVQSGEQPPGRYHADCSGVAVPLDLGVPLHEGAVVHQTCPWPSSFCLYQCTLVRWRSCERCGIGLLERIERQVQLKHIEIRLAKDTQETSMYVIHDELLHYTLAQTTGSRHARHLVEGRCNSYV